MVANDGTRAVDPSQYIAQHLQHFTGSGPSAFAAGDYARTFVWSTNGLVVAVVLLVVVTGLAALTDRGSLFRLNPVMGFGKRLYVWWSCAWRQWFASTLFFFTGVIAFHSLVAKATLPLMGFTTHLITSGATRTSPAWPFALMEIPVVLAILIYLLLSLPLAGYMVRSGLVAHAISETERFGLWRATLLGVTTYAWSIPGGLLIAELAIWFPHHVAEMLRGLCLVAWGMYIVLPRQLRRMTRLDQPG
ncbi:hypothetical protein AWB69_02427 [Caballeronia udeis]|uniref:Uncharacterized protein n=1 Tax=Caballeronia udeis TaxID=1232866 RepID=A0A158GE88_9BURK|nr:hypothetical protein [Caballeronia udeis]SAL29939.1 hypothetical protein AWB69_02427 [Caballeronia udeis]